jgi:hypothetical protein
LKVYRLDFMFMDGTRRCKLPTMASNTGFRKNATFKIHNCYTKVIIIIKCWISLKLGAWTVACNYHCFFMTSCFQSNCNIFKVFGISTFFKVHFCNSINQKVFANVKHKNYKYIKMLLHKSLYLKSLSLSSSTVAGCNNIVSYFWYI